MAGIGDKPFLQSPNWAENNRKVDLGIPVRHFSTWLKHKPNTGTQYSLLNGSSWLSINLAALLILASSRTFCPHIL